MINIVYLNLSLVNIAFIAGMYLSYQFHKILRKEESRIRSEISKIRGFEYGEPVIRELEYEKPSIYATR